jgi:hypothetical protein
LKLSNSKGLQVCKIRLQGLITNDLSRLQVCKPLYTLLQITNDINNQLNKHKMKNLKQKTINKILLNGSFKRKPVDFKDVKNNLFEAYEDFFTELVETLPVFTIEQLGIKKPTDHFNIENINVPMLFILETYENKYLINTEGSNYCRYVILIE